MKITEGKVPEGVVHRPRGARTSKYTPIYDAIRTHDMDKSSLCVEFENDKDAERARISVDQHLRRAHGKKYPFKLYLEGKNLWIAKKKDS